MRAVTTPGVSSETESSRRTTVLHQRLWRTAGWLAIAHVLLVFAGAGMSASTQVGDPVDMVRKAFVTSSLSRAMAGGYLTLLGFLALLAGGLLLARLLAGTDELTGWLASCIAGSTTAWVAVTVAGGLAAGATAAYDGHHGGDLDTVRALGDLHSFAFVLTAGLMGLFLVALGWSGFRSAQLGRALSASAAVIGVASILSVPGTRIGLPNVTTMAWFLWFLVFGVTVVRGASRR